MAHELFHTAKRVACVPEPLYCYRLREGSICRTDLTPARFDSVTALVMRCEYFAKKTCRRSCRIRLWRPAGTGTSPCAPRPKP